MNYEQGIAYMISLAEKLKEKKQATGSFMVGTLLVSYPGKKKKGDYRLSENGIAPTHIDLVKIFHKHTTQTNFSKLSASLEDIYHHGLNTTSGFFSKNFMQKIFWITLQEEINYPPPKYAGRKLPFQRFYEGALAKLGHCKLEEVLKRTMNHGKKKPNLYAPASIKKFPVFYK